MVTLLVFTDFVCCKLQNTKKSLFYLPLSLYSSSTSRSSRVELALLATVPDRVEVAGSRLAASD